jgi:[acyl-carrier-protein] S-malonyltransferase
MSFAVLCSGQGAQYPDMLSALPDSPDIKPILTAFEHVAGLSVADLANTAAAEIFSNRLAQPLICAYQLATWRLLQDELGLPAAFAGYSIGELAAYGCAGALSAEQTLALARRRAELMDAACAEPAGMFAVRGLAQREMTRLAAETGAAIAIVNGPDRFVIGGLMENLEHLQVKAEGAGAHVTRLPVAVASHTSLLKSAVPTFKAALDADLTRDPPVPVLAGISGLPVFRAARAREALAAQIAQAIDWRACLQALPEMGCRVALELGPGADLSRMARDQIADLDVRSVADFRSLDGAVRWVKSRLAA